MGGRTKGQNYKVSTLIVVYSKSILLLDGLHQRQNVETEKQCIIIQVYDIVLDGLHFVTLQQQSVEAKLS